MHWRPYESETLVIPLSPEEIHRRLSLGVKQVDFQSIQKRGEAPDMHIFNGHITEEHFKISLLIERPDNFLPLIQGKVDGTSKGSILFIQYKLFASTKVFMGFWCCLALLMAFLIYIQNHIWWYSALVIIGGLFNYWITVVNFHRKLRLSKTALHRLLL